MNDAEETMPAEIQRDGELILYDFFKHLTSIVVLTLGGVLIIAQDFDPTDVKPFMIVTAIGVIGLAGVLAFSGSSEIVRARYTGLPTQKSLQFLRVAAPALLSVGVGLFLAMFVDSLS